MAGFHAPGPQQLLHLHCCLIPNGLPQPRQRGLVAELLAPLEVHRVTQMGLLAGVHVPLQRLAHSQQWHARSASAVHDFLHRHENLPETLLHPGALYAVQQRALHALLETGIRMDHIPFLAHDSLCPISFWTTHSRLASTSHRNSAITGSMKTAVAETISSLADPGELVPSPFHPEVHRRVVEARLGLESGARPPADRQGAQHREHGGRVGRGDHGTEQHGGARVDVEEQVRRTRGDRHADGHADGREGRAPLASAASRSRRCPSETRTPTLEELVLIREVLDPRNLRDREVPS